jgi:hypothetical protein
MQFLGDPREQRAKAIGARHLEVAAAAVVRQPAQFEDPAG